MSGGDTIRALTATDAPVLAALTIAHMTELGHPPTEPPVDLATRLKAELAETAPVLRGLIAEADGRPLGFLLFYLGYSSLRQRRNATLLDLYVRPDARRQGIGRRLVAALAARAKADGLDHLLWTVNRDNETAARFYAAIGAGQLDARMMALEGAALEALASAG